MTDLLADIRERMVADYALTATRGGKHLRQGLCPSCANKSLWTYADSPWVLRCERLNNCGWEAHAKELYADFFESWTDRFQKPEEAKPEAQRNPTAAADAYLQHGRGFDLALVKGLYTQEHYYDQRADNGRGAGTATVRFAVADTWWERLIDRPARFGKKKANFKTGGSYAGHWWTLPTLSFIDPGPDADADQPKPPAELWLVEGIFDAIALVHHGIAAVALMSCNNYPEHALAALDALLKRQGGTVKHPTLVWALDGDRAGRGYTQKHAQRARDAGWTCEAAQIPQPRTGGKQDWNDLHQRARLEPDHLKTYRYHGALLLAPTARDKALLMHEHTGRAEFDLEHGNRLWWFELKEGAFNKMRDDVQKHVEDGKLSKEEADAQIAEARRSCTSVRRIANCNPRCLYYQKNEVTDEAWYYFRIAFPDDRPAIKGTFTAGQLTAAAEFEKRLLHMAPGAMWSGSAIQLKHIMGHQLEAPKEVQTVDFIGYSSQHKAYILGETAVREGQVHQANADDYFDFGRLSVKTLQKSIKLQIATGRAEPTGWPRLLWASFGAKGIVALAYWLGTLFAEQIRAAQQSLFFMEIVGEPGAGKTTLITFLWKLLGRDYEGFDPSKSTTPGRLRTFTQVSNLPIVLIESDRERQDAGPKVRSFDWDELKDAYNGNPIRTTGVKTGGNETYDPPFRASIVISQNNPVQASQAVMERICHLGFDTSRFTAEGFAAAKALEALGIEQVSGFVLAALKREAEIVAHITDSVDGHMRYLLSLDGIAKPRIAKNHAQLLAMTEAACRLLRLPEQWLEAARAQIEQMARERQAAISADPPVVAEFWEAFDYLDGLGLYDQQMGRHIDKPLLNHSCSPQELIAVNLNQFVEIASQKRQQVPLLSHLKKELQHSKSRPFEGIKTVASAIQRRIVDGDDKPKSVHCWVFRRHAGKKR
ncbi:MAG: toprim domain-containing protein [Desulfovibrionaceae bacterium]|nr:toprim domain-containing protein [Desulfovibrionaceae bacterium]